MLPITGQGGNSAIETAAVLTNNLIKCLQSSIHSKPTVEELDVAFEKVQELRIPRLRKLVTVASKRQAADSMLGPELKRSVITQVPEIPPEVIFRGWLAEFVPAASLSMLPVPSRPRTVPYLDEQAQRKSGKGDTMAKL
jgi:2-polyprenyl-6-methoxyphenol hydroxylase-like FAD-dependent oxidoreductase